jgi:hypothetical protein
MSGDYEHVPDDALEMDVHPPGEDISFEEWVAAWLPELNRRIAASDGGTEPAIPIEEAWPRIAGKHATGSSSSMMQDTMTVRRIRFVGGRDHSYSLKLGPIEPGAASIREFHGGDQVEVQMRPSRYGVDCFDLTFADGEFAIEVSSDYFVVVDH